MLLEIVALLFIQAPAVPQNSIPTATEVAAEITPAAASDTITKFESPEDDQAASSNPAPQAPTSEEVSQNSEPYPGSSVALTPGRLVPRPTGPTNQVFVGSVSLLSSPAPAPLTAAPLSPTQISEQRRQRVWLMLSIAQHGAATFDAWSTRRLISSGQERNPLLRPFAGNASLYAVIQVGPALLDFVGRRMMIAMAGLDVRGGYRRRWAWARHSQPACTILGCTARRSPAASTASATDGVRIGIHLNQENQITVNVHPGKNGSTSMIPRTIVLSTVRDSNQEPADSSGNATLLIVMFLSARPVS